MPNFLLITDAIMEELIKQHFPVEVAQSEKDLPPLTMRKQMHCGSQLVTSSELYEKRLKDLPIH